VLLGGPQWFNSAKFKASIQNPRHQRREFGTHVKLRLGPKLHANNGGPEAAGQSFPVLVNRLESQGVAIAATWLALSCWGATRVLNS
jgi:hypothetical protein